jgi:DNA-binding NarL/FixJ family response regulator
MPFRRNAPPARTVGILIADDHQIFREGLRKLLEAEPGFVIVGDASDGAEAIDKVRALKPDILLLDLSMPRVHGLDTLRELADAHNETRVLLLTAEIDKSQLITSLQLGARGVVTKDCATSQLLKAIHCVMNGEYWVGRESVSDLVLALRASDGDKARETQPNLQLTDREVQIMALIVSAAGNREIAEKLGISERTVKHHLTNIFDKVGVSTRLELAMYAIQQRHESPEPEPSK